MNGLTLWAGSGPSTRALFVRLACDGDRAAYPTATMAQRLTIAQALEVAEVNRKERIKRIVLVDLACDADYQRLADGKSQAARLTIAQALEVA